jgi:hypothetical protein
MATVAIVAIVLAVIAVPVGAHLGVDHRDEVPRAVAVPRQLVPGVLPVALPVVVGGVVSVVVHVIVYVKKIILMLTNMIRYWY